LHTTSAQSAGSITLQDTMTAEDWRLTMHPDGVDPSEEFALILTMDAQADVHVATVEFNSSENELDIYYPPDFDFAHALPTVFMVPAINDQSMVGYSGTGFRDFRTAVDYATLCAASGMAAVLFECASQPYFVAKDVLNYVAANHDRLHIDPDRFGILSVSGQAQTALTLLSHADIEAVDWVRAFVALYPHIESVPRPATTPDVLLVTAGSDLPQRRTLVDRAIARLQFYGIEPSIVEYPAGVHHFDSAMNTEQSRDAIQAALDFLAAELDVGM